jgi:two-component system, cell cycle sensor histidine kinase and response regulator CckA
MPAPNPQNRTRGRVLFMDDEEAIRDVVGLMLRRRGFDVTLVGDGREAVAAFGAAISRGVPYDAVVLDLVVPGGAGALEAIGPLRRLDPGVRALVSSGHARDPAMADPAAHGFAGVIPKPYEIAALVAALDRAGGILHPA